MSNIVAKESHFLTTLPGDDLRARLEAFVEDKDAFSPNTWRQLMSVMRISLRWAEQNGRQFFPMSSTDLRDYLNWLQAGGRASSTVATHAALLATLHRNAGLVAPTTSPLVFRTIKKINRSAVVSGERTGQAVPFKMTDLQIIDRCWAGSTQLQQVRNLAFLHLAYNTLLRVSELARLRVRDISRAADGRIILDVAWTKTIVQTGGLIKALSSASSRRLSEWLTRSGLAAEPDAFIFCPVHRSNKVTIATERPLSLPALEAIFSQAWREAGPATPAPANKGRYQGWSGHSARVGAAQDLAGKGYSVAQIMQEGTWKKPETLMRYIRNVDAHKGAMVDFMEMQ
ncbi:MULTISPECIES: tyrosine-type recombinase/integrase [unclassified Erwinia]|uniref:tyrosine-type recombinase/integrase n=1 Tax=unclassified Erwinia TaxID=2622719 RepID=UPI0006F66A5D|nr:MULTISPECIES: tyrosine-type recombinase/integrase [unclassified Erwinia]KQN55630.1 recombinase Cre [Erwinia sp. Leaf53]PLV63675.1 Cre [Erwinia sp. B116]